MNDGDAGVPGDPDVTDGDRRSGEDRRRRRFFAELSDQHRAWLSIAAACSLTWIVAMWYQDVVGLPKDLRDLGAKVTSVETKVDAANTKIDATNTEVRIIKETGFSSQDAQRLAEAVSGLKGAVDGLTQHLNAVDNRVQRLENRSNP